MTRTGDTNGLTLGVVSFLNARPLIEGLDAEPDIRLEYAVPSALAGMLLDGQVDAALIPVVDLGRRAGGTPGGGAWEQVSDACIGSDGPTLTVRAFSRVPPERMTTLHVDGDSHTSVALARLIWSRCYGRRLALVPLAEAAGLDRCESVLLIGDKVVTMPPHEFAYEIDLGEAWKRWTGLPFVFAVWVAGAGWDNAVLARRLNAARDRGVARAAEIAAEVGPNHGWPVELACEYLTRRLMYTLTAAARAGLERFLDLASADGLLAARQELVR